MKLFMKLDVKLFTTFYNFFKISPMILLMKLYMAKQ